MGNTYIFYVVLIHAAKQNQHKTRKKKFHSNVAERSEGIEYKSDIYEPKWPASSKDVLCQMIASWCWNPGEV